MPLGGCFIAGAPQEPGSPGGILPRAEANPYLRVHAEWLLIRSLTW